MSECPCENDLPEVCPVCGARASVPGEACRPNAPQDAEIARLRHHISRALANLLCGFTDLAQKELEQTLPAKPQAKTPTAPPR